MSAAGGRDRKQGRTSQMVYNLPDEPCLIVVHTAPMILRVKQLVAQCYGPEAVIRHTYAIIRDEVDIDRHVRGLRRPIVVDHEYWKYKAISDHVKARLKMFQERQEAMSKGQQ